MKNIVVIGIGALGKRHIQSLTELSEAYNIYGVESNESIVLALKEEFPKVNFFQQIEDLPKEIEVCIISTTSSSRRMVFQQLTEHASIKMILFEKVLFQKKEDYYYVEERLSEKGIKAWVNCARREWPIYYDIRDRLQSEKTFSISVSGGSWSLGCNGIHFLDLIQYLSGTDSISIDYSVFEKGIEKSKREGFYELYGTLFGQCGKCRAYQITCLKEFDSPIVISISASNIRIIVDEGKRKFFVSQLKNGWEWEISDFTIPYQSELTSVEIKKMVENKSELPSYKEAMMEHLVFIDVMYEAFVNNGLEDNGVCPIT